MMQLRTGKIGLVAYLAKIDVRESDLCTCGFGRETSDNCVSAALSSESMGFEISWTKVDVDPEIHNRNK